MIFVGSHELTIDSKNRLSIPSAVRSDFLKVAQAAKKRSGEAGAAEKAAAKDGEAEAGGESDATFALYLVPGMRRNILSLYSEEYFEASRDWTPPTEQLSQSTQDWIRLEASIAARAEPDNQGRILVPDRLLKRLKLGKDVTMVGAKDHYEVWARDDYDAFLEANWLNYEQNLLAAQAELAKYRPAGSQPRM